MRKIAAARRRGVGFVWAMAWRARSSSGGPGDHRERAEAQVCVGPLNPGIDHVHLSLYYVETTKLNDQIQEIGIVLPECAVAVEVERDDE